MVGTNVNLLPRSRTGSEIPLLPEGLISGGAAVGVQLYAVDQVPDSIRHAWRVCVCSIHRSTGSYSFDTGYKHVNHVSDLFGMYQCQAHLVWFRWKPLRCRCNGI